MKYPDRPNRENLLCDCGHRRGSHEQTFFDFIFRDYDISNGKCMRCMCGKFQEA